MSRDDQNTLDAKPKDELELPSRANHEQREAITARNLEIRSDNEELLRRQKTIRESSTRIRFVQVLRQLMALTSCHRSRPSPEPSWIIVEVSISLTAILPIPIDLIVSIS